MSAQHSGPGAWDHLKRAFSAYRAHQMTDRAAALTYFGMLSLFPGLLMVVSLLTLVGQQDIAPRAAGYLLDNGADKTTADAVRNALDAMIRTSSGAAGIALLISLGLALNAASAAFAAAGRALNVVNGIADGRGFVHRKLVDLAWTLAVVVLVLFTLIAVLLGGTVADDALRSLGLGDAGATVWRWARWPAGLAAVMAAFALVYTFAPDIEPRRVRWITPGSAFALGAWAIASLGFSVYIANFSAYGAAYGTFGAAIVLLLWIYVACNAFLFGAELNVAIVRSRTAGRGGPPVLTPPPGSPTTSAPRGSDAR